MGAHEIKTKIVQRLLKIWFINFLVKKKKKVPQIFPKQKDLELIWTAEIYSSFFLPQDSSRNDFMKMIKSSTGDSATGWAENVFLHKIKV